MSGLNGPRSRSGCWTCRARKVKCDEGRPKCEKCIKRNRECDYEPRKRAPRGSGQGPRSLHLEMNSKPKAIAIAPAATSVSPASTLVDLESDLPYGIKAADWPVALTSTDRRALDHYAAYVVPRMILKTARWSSYSYVLLMCAKHPLLAHLVTAFSVRDMAKENENELLTIAMEHYQKALSLFIEHLSAPQVTGWITFPALWFFIIYEQTYGDDPNVLQTHLRGVRDVIITHGAAILPGSLHDEANAGQEAPPKYWVPPQMIDRMALWTIHHDAKASTFGLGASIVTLLDEHYPGAVAKISKSSINALQDAWGSDYPVQEEIWDMQIEILYSFAHDATMLRYELSDIEKENVPIDPGKLLSFSRKLKELQEFMFHSPVTQN
ncbi:uncharacterized protein N7503_010556 [Penicillium pulvis]|uniref:uncharacterized protein n=1 Tax=Penicillium pulvis TaxID=1562058 RepID=UPI00254682ED|nr:uncharacterized protein N7503_010556 [Penicillium pulvis]KAJ5785344.1 hypothetical protein N7503_010556 [Penicillium pulvis]